MKQVLNFLISCDIINGSSSSSSSISSLVGVVADIVVVIITSTTTIVNLFLVLVHFLVNRLLMACGQPPGRTC